MTSKNNRKERKHYVNKQDIFHECVKYRQALLALRESGKKGLPKMSNTLGKMLIDMCHGIISKPCFNGYTYKDEMLDNAIVKAVNAVKYFNPEKSQNAFAFISQVIFIEYKSFITAEKRRAKVKVDIMLDPTQDNFYYAEQEMLNASYYHKDTAELTDFVYGARGW